MELTLKSNLHTPLLYSTIQYMYRQSLRLRFSTALASGFFCGLIGLVTLVNAAQALQSFSLQDALQTGLNNSPVVQKADAKRSEGKWRAYEGISTFLPEITLTGTHFVEKKYQFLNANLLGQSIAFPLIFPTSSAAADLKWLIFDGFGNLELYKASSRISEAGDLNFNWVSFQAGHDISILYARVVATKKLAYVSEQNLSTLQTHLNQTKQLKLGGQATHYDVLRVESQLSQAEVDLLLAKDDIQIAQENLSKALGINEPADAKDSELSEPTPEKFQNLTYTRDTHKRQDLGALEGQVDATNLVESSRSKYWVPKLYLIGEYSKYNNITDPLSDWSNYRSAYSLGFQITWDIFSPKALTKSKEELYQAIQGEKDLVSANLQAPVDFAFWKKRYLYSAANYHAKKVDVDRASETVRLAQAGFRAGIRTTTEVLDAELDLFRARAGIVTAQMNCIEAKEKLELALGENL